MKALLIGMVTMALMTQAQASGCIGGDWQVVSSKRLGKVKISTDYYGGSDVSVYLEGNYAYVNFKNVGTVDRKFDFSSGGFDISKAPVETVIRTLQNLPATLPVDAHETIENTTYYDDCIDAPAGSQRKTITYSFTLKLPQGNKLLMSESEISIHPPTTP